MVHILAGKFGTKEVGRAGPNRDKELKSFPGNNKSHMKLSDDKTKGTFHTQLWHVRNSVNVAAYRIKRSLVSHVTDNLYTCVRMGILVWNGCYRNS